MPGRRENAVNVGYSWLRHRPLGEEAACRVRGSRRRRVAPTGRGSIPSPDTAILGSGAVGAGAIGASALGALALGAAALGVVAVGAFAIGRLSVGRARVGALEVGSLEIDTLTVRSVRMPERG